MALLPIYDALLPVFGAVAWVWRCCLLWLPISVVKLYNLSFINRIVKREGGREREEREVKNKSQKKKLKRRDALAVI